jgi:N4-gp56 family major capsid protein
MNKKEFIMRALDTSNAFISTGAEATAVNPNIWDFRLREYEEKNLVVAPQAEQFDFRGPGVDYKVTIDSAPSSATLLTETTDIAISSFATRNITFTPKEYGAAYQLTRKEAVRAFFNVAERMVKKLGYAMAQKKDSLAVAAVNTAASNSVFVNSKTAATAIASTDTLDYASITAAIREIENDLYTPKKLFISYNQKEALLNLSTVNDVSKFGTRQAVAKGLVGELFGLEIFVSHSITEETSGSATYHRAIVMGESGTGEMALGYAIKRDPIIEREYHARGRYWDIVAHEEYDFQVLHPEALCLIYSY